MKPTHLLLIALLALAVGCKTTEKLSSGGYVDEPEAAQKDDSATIDSGTNTDPIKDPLAIKTDGSTTGLPKSDPLSITGATKAPETSGAAATNPAITTDSLTGEYSGALFEETIQFLMSLAPPEKRKDVEGELRGATIMLALTADNKYSMTTKSAKRTETSVGTWNYDDKTGIATLSAPEVSAEQLARLKAQGVTEEQIAASKKQTMACQVSKDGKTLTYSQEQMGMKNGITFTKK